MRHMPRNGTGAQRGYGRPWEKIRLAILQRDGYICQLCHRYGDTVDHITPIHAGGTHDFSNLRCLCRTCNSRLGAQYGNPLRQPTWNKRRDKGTTTEAFVDRGFITGDAPPSRNW